jgi:N-succinyl-L-ornithine transcarbamylase
MNNATPDLLKVSPTGVKYFTSVKDVTNVDALVTKALTYKANPLLDKNLGAGKRIGLLFLNPSMRTRLSTQIAASNLGMEPIVLNVDNKEGWALEFGEGAVMNGDKVEHIKDAAPILGLYFDILCIRTFPSLKNRDNDYNELYLSQFIKYAGIPVVSMESAIRHPLQSLADVMTIKETFRGNRKPKVVLTWAPHVKPLPQSVSNSFAEWIRTWGQADFVITHPEKYELAEEFTKGTTITYNQDEALKDADYIYVKNWSAYNDYGKILSNDLSWMLTNEKLNITNHAKVMHCLPVRRNIELSDEILDSPNSITTLEAGNRVWATQTVLSEILSPHSLLLKRK